MFSIYYKNAQQIVKNAILLTVGSVQVQHFIYKEQPVSPRVIKAIIQIKIIFVKVFYKILL